MQLDVVELRNFYATALGEAARGYLSSYIQARWNVSKNLNFLGLGYASPFLEEFRGDAQCAINFMPAEQGVANWPHNAPSSVALVETHALPLPDSCVDRALVIHALEVSNQPQELMMEIWRVLAPGGRMIVIAPNRSGLWSRVDRTPFGFGRPFSRRQLLDLMRAALFTPLHWHEALYAPPFSRRLYLRLSPAFEAVCVKLSLPGGGVLAVEATKQLYRPIFKRRPFEEAIAMREPALASAAPRGWRSSFDAAPNALSERAQPTCARKARAIKEDGGRLPIRFERKPL